MTTESLFDALATGEVAFVMVVCVYWIGTEILNRIEGDR